MIITLFLKLYLAIFPNFIIESSLSEDVLKLKSIINQSRLENNS